MAHSSEVTIIEASPEAVWKVVSDGDRLADWFTPIEEVRGSDSQGALADGSALKDPDGRQGSTWAEDDSSGGRSGPQAQVHNGTVVRSRAWNRDACGIDA